MQIVYIKWRDAYLSEGWHSRIETEQIKNKSVQIVESVGWLIDQDGNRVIISQSTSTDLDSYSEILKIPMEAVVEWQILPQPNPENDGQVTEGVVPFDIRLPTLQHQEIISD